MEDQILEQPVTEDTALENAENTQPAETAEPKNAERREPIMVPVTEAHLRDSVKILSTIIGFMGLDAVVKARAGTGRILLTVTSPDAGRIIGRKGQTLEAIQFIMLRMLIKGITEFPRISIDIDGYARQNGQQAADGESTSADVEKTDDAAGEKTERPRKFEKRPRFDKNRRDDDRGQRRGSFQKGDFNRDRISPEREETLTQQALDYAKEVMKWGEPITLPPMNAMERRIIHIALQEHPNIKTESIGEGVRKSVVISQQG